MRPNDSLKSEPVQIAAGAPFISDATLEELAEALLDRYEAEIEPITAPPVPVEQIADFLLELNIEWLDIPDTEEAPILAYLHPASQTIRLNERHLAHFEQHPGVYEYTLAHEIAHYQLHVTETTQSDHFFVYRHRQVAKDRREWQAERFASYLLMPGSLLLPAIDGLDLQHWPTLYRLRDQFRVSITALTIRLEAMGYLHVAANGRLYPTKQAAGNDLRQALQRLIGQGQLHRTLGEVDQARTIYQHALTIAQELGDRRSAAFIAWALGLLYIELDPVRAIELMTICVTYEQEVGHPNAAVDAAYLAQVKAQLDIDN